MSMMPYSAKFDSPDFIHWTTLSILDLNFPAQLYYPLQIPYTAVPHYLLDP